MQKRSLKTTEMNMLEGSLWDRMLFFAVPLILTSLAQQLFNAADSAVVGHFAGKAALAAVGGGGPIFGCVLNVFLGVSIGANVVIARSIGAGERDRLRTRMTTALITAAGCGILLAMGIRAFMDPILDIMQVPDDVAHSTATYLGIYCLAMPFQLVYNVCAAILRSFGETKKPVVVITAAGILNVVLNVTFVVGFHWDVAGVAGATVISNIMSSMLLLRIVVKGYLPEGPKEDVGSTERESLFDTRAFRQMMQIGIPAGLQGAVSSLSHLTIQASVNSLGATVMVASTVAIIYESFAATMLTAFGHAVVTFTSQNAGAGNEPRCRQVLRTGMALGSVFVMAFAAIVIIFGHSISLIFTPDREVIDLAMLRVTCIMTLQFLNLFIECLTGAFRGRGYSMAPALICMYGKCGMRIAWVLVTFHFWRSFEMVVLSYPFSWIMTLMVLVPVYFHIRKKGLR